MSYHSKWVLPPTWWRPCVFLHPSTVTTMTLLHTETYFVGLALQCFQLLVYAPDVYDDGDPTPLSSHSTGLATESNSTTSSHNFPTVFSNSQLHVYIMGRSTAPSIPSEYMITRVASLLTSIY